MTMKQSLQRLFHPSNIIDLKFKFRIKKKEEEEKDEEEAS